MVGKRLRNIIWLLIFCILRKKKYAQLVSQELFRILKKKKLLLIIPNEEKEGWHYHAVKKLSALLTRITSKHDDKYHCLDCCPSSKTKRNLKYHENAHKSKVFCGILMPSKRGNILEYNQ